MRDIKEGLFIDYTGDKRWYHHGQLHRENGPAVEWSNGSKEWFIRGQRHREDGPAVDYVVSTTRPKGLKQWYLYDETYFTEEAYQEQLQQFRRVDAIKPLYGITCISKRDFEPESWWRKTIRGYEHDVTRLDETPLRMNDLNEAYQKIHKLTTTEDVGYPRDNYRFVVEEVV